MAAPSMGVLAQLGMASSGAATEAFEFISETLTTKQEVRRNEGIRGTRLHPKERVRRGRTTPGGTIRMEPTYAELVNMLPRIVAAASAQVGYDTYTVSDTVPVAFDVQIDRVAKVFSYTGCRTNRCTFRAQSGGILEVDWDIEALTETIGNAGTFPSLTISGTPPFIFEDSTLTIGGSAYPVQEFECVIDWHLKVDRFMNSTTRAYLPSMDFSCMCKFVVPYCDTTALYDDGGDVLGQAADINFTYSGAGGGAAGVNLKLAFANLIFPAEKSPSVQSKDEVTMLLQGEARRSSTTSPLIVTLDNTIA